VVGGTLVNSSDARHENALIKQNEVIISLLAQSIIGIESIHRTVIAGKKDQAAYVRAYNALDGDIGVTDAAKIAGVSQPTMTPILRHWEAQGIVYNMGDSRRPLYKRLVFLPQKVESSPSIEKEGFLDKQRRGNS
jgi:hypothetical protein